MREYGIKLKTKAKIAKLCYETEDGTLGEDGIEFNGEVLTSNKFFKPNGVRLMYSIEYNTDRDRYYVIENAVGAKVAIHFDWIDSVDGFLIDRKNEISNDLTQLNSKYTINLVTTELTDISTLPQCECGAVGIIDMEDGKYLCRTCTEELVQPHSYSYKPEFNFIGSQLSNDVETPTWYGIEIEVSTNKEALGKFLYKNKNKKSVYLKEDSSIQGDGFRTEIVSMPHSFSSLMSKDSWLNDVSSVPTNDSDSNGVHVHISRTAFKDDKHYSLFYFLIHQMEAIATKVGGRKLTSYCKMLPTGRVHSKKNTTTDGEGRSLFLNEQNDKTVEARFFKGTTNTNNLKAYVQFLESMIKYTKYHSKRVTVKGWFAYFTKKSSKYSELIALINTLEGVEGSEAVVTYKEPKRHLKELRWLPIGSLYNIVEIKTSDGTYKGVRVIEIDLRRKQITFDSSSNNRDCYDISDIVSVVVEEA